MSGKPFLDSSRHVFHWTGRKVDLLWGLTGVKTMTLNFRAMLIIESLPKTVLQFFFQGLRNLLKPIHGHEFLAKNHHHHPQPHHRSPQPSLEEGDFPNTQICCCPVSTAESPA